MSCKIGSSYTVKSGDTLFIIAQQKLGDGKRWREIKKPDGTPVTDADATNLQVGQEICIPNEPTPPPPKGMVQEILNAHNSYRSEVGVPPLAWSDLLASHAQEWANYLAATQSFKHSGANGEGENLWMGTSGRFSFTQMVESWGNEKQHFKMGTFPDVSTTENWADVGHYTQVVWRNTTQVGCAVADGGDGNTRLVCRYSPPGNFVGQQPF